MSTATTSTSLTPVDLNQLPSTQLGTDEQFAAASRASRFLDRLQLFSKGEAINTGLIPPGTYGIAEAGKKIVKLSSQIDVLPLARRMKALDLSNKELGVINNYDPTSDQYKDIQKRSDLPNSGCMWGVSFLVFERSTGRFLEFFLGTPSFRPLAGDLAVYCPLSQADIDRRAAAGADVSQAKPHFAVPCTLKVRLAKSKKGFSWHVPDIQPCSVPFENLPAQEIVLDEITRFLAPKITEVETVAEDPDKKTRAR